MGDDPKLFWLYEFQSSPIHFSCCFQRAPTKVFSHLAGEMSGILLSELIGISAEVGDNSFFRSVYFLDESSIGCCGSGAGGLACP